MKFNPDDPKYTAYVLNELTDKERDAVEQEMKADPSLRQWIEDTRAFADQLSSTLSGEAGVEMDDAQRATVLHAAGHPSTASRLRRPVWKTVTAMAAALVLAVIGVQYYVQTEQQDMASSPTVEVELVDQVEEVKLDTDRLPYELNVRIDSPELDAKKTEENRAASSPVSDLASVSPPQASPLVMKGLYKGVSSGGRMARSRQNVRDEGYNSMPILSPSLDDFAELQNNRFVRVEDHPVSTFSIDVDTASYAVMRKFLNEGQMPPMDAIRVEELINYFPYDYAPPSGDAPFAAHLQATSCPWAPTHHLVRIALKGREIDSSVRPPLNLVYLIDVSGSMHPENKLPLIKRALQALVQQLDERDHISIVVYAGSSGLVLPATRGDQAPRILDALDRLQAGGSTAGGAGIQLAYNVARENFVEEAVNRVILCTDGDFNVGLTQRGDLERLIEEEAKSGVFLTVLGFGMGNYKDSTLELLSNKGNGNYGYIDNFTEGRKMLVDQMLGTLVTIAKDVKIQVEFNPAAVAGYRLIGYENRLLKKEDFNNDKIDAGDIGAGHTVTAFYEVIPAGQPVNDVPGVDPLKYQQPAETAIPASDEELLTVKLRYKEPDGEISSKLEFPLRTQAVAQGELAGDFRFATAVAAFGQILRNNPEVEGFTFQRVLALAEEAIGNDPFGYRAEFIKLVRNAQAISGQ